MSNKCVYRVGFVHLPQKETFMSRIFVCFAVIILLSGLSLGQSSEKPTAFEIADVHVSPPSGLANQNGPVNGTPRGGRYEMRNATMLDLIRNAYNSSDEKIFGGPTWLAADRFDVI